MPTLYDVFGVKPDAGVREIRSAYLRLAKLYHPDKNFGDEIAGQQFSDVKVAYEFLRDDENRKLYDAHLENIRRQSRQRTLRHGFIYGFGFVATFCIVFVGVRSYMPNRPFEPVVASPSFQNRDPKARARWDLSGTTGGQATAQPFDPDRHDPVIPAPEIQPMALQAREGEDPPEQIQHARPPPLRLPPQIAEPEQAPYDRGLLNNAIAAASNSVNPSNATTTTAQSPDTRQVRVWARYRDDTGVVSQNLTARVFIVEHEGPDARPKSESVPTEMTASSAAPREKRDVRVRRTFRGSKYESEIRMVPQVITIQRE